MKARRSIVPLTVFALFALSAAAAPPQQDTADPYAGELAWRQIGPVNMSGRVSDIEALDSDFSYVVLGSASGGVFKSINAGTTWESIFDDYGSSSIGDVAIFQPDPDIIWVGTGEECIRNTVSWGDGVYKSTDGGATFQNMGLENSYTIASIITHPTDPDIVWVAAGGNPWGRGGERGVFKTTDGGATWQKLTNGLPDDDLTGASDLVIDRSDPDVLYAGLWDRIREPNRLLSGGPDSGVYKTSDGGASWTRLTAGLPEGDIGKVGVAVARSNPDVVMAFIEHGVQLDEDDPDYADMSVLGTGLYRSEDGGESWQYVNRYQSRPFYYSHIWINPADDQMVYVVTGTLLFSDDGGRTLERQSDTRIHGDHHALWVDPQKPERFYMGTDGGAALSQDGGATYEFFDNLVLGQFYTLTADMRDPYWVWGGLQDNGTWGGPSKVRDPNGILFDHWVKIGGGDGFHAQADPSDWRTVYFESQPNATGGNQRRADVLTGETVNIGPRRDNIVNWDDYITDEIVAEQEAKNWPTPFRCNWSTPMVLSPNNPGALYIGCNHLFMSVDQGDSWRIISPDLTKNDPERTIRKSGGLTAEEDASGGAENYGTIITIAESTVRPGLIWVGTDDGNVQFTRDFGAAWTDVTANLPVPAGLWVTRVEASHFDEATAYVTIDGHRSANFHPWVLKTTDYGQSWVLISADLPDGEPALVVREDPSNPNLLFVGTERSIHFSIDGGDSWRKLNNNMPTVAVHEILIHPRDRDLIVATHGRGVWILDDITALEQLTPEVLSSDAHLFEQRPFTRWARIQKSDPRMGYQVFAGDNYDVDTVPIDYYIGSGDGEVMLEITSVDGRKHTAVIDAAAGMQQYRWNLRFDGPPLNDAQIGFIEQQLVTMIDEWDAEQAAEGGPTLADVQERLAAFRAATDDAHRMKAIRGLDGVRVGPTGGGGRGSRGGGRGGFRGGFGAWGEPAGTGEFLVRMTAGDVSETATLVVKADPILQQQ
jgi:photosystem II stability/assembly factor-like uncharacterized protein